MIAAEHEIRLAEFIGERYGSEADPAHAAAGTHRRRGREQVVLGTGNRASLTPEPLEKLATPAGFEPATTRLEGECSIRLSYGA